MANNALSESFDNGFGAISNAWNVDTSVKGEVKLAGSASMMEWATGPDAGHGYGTYTVTAKVDGNQPGAGIILWPGDNQWPGQEIDMVEITPDGSGRHYGTVHWNSNGSDAYDAKVFDGVQGGVFHDYQMVWEPGKITFKVDGAEKGVITDHVPADFEHGGMNNTIGFLNNNANTAITVSHVDFTPLGGNAPAAASAPAQVSSASTPDEAPAPAQASSASTQNEVPANTQAADHVVTSAPVSGSGAADWNAIAAQVQAHYEATGHWDLNAGTSLQAAPAHVEAAPAVVDWNALAAQATANMEAHGQWFI